MALDPVTVIREMARGGPLQPTVVIEISPKIENLFDAREAAAWGLMSSGLPIPHGG